MMLEEGEKLIRTFKDETSGMGKIAADGHKGTIGKIEAGIGLVYGTFFITNQRLIFESEKINENHSHIGIDRTEGVNFRSGFFPVKGTLKIIKNEFSKGMHSCTYQIHCGKEISDYLNQEFYTQEIKNERLMNKAKEYEKHLNYENAIKIYEEIGRPTEAARVRKLKADMAAPKTEIHGDYVDDRDTIVKDSVVNKSNIGAGGKSKAEEIKEIKELLDSGAIDDDEFKQMKKEILGK